MQQNIFESVPENIPQELFEKLIEGNSFRVEKIVSDGHTSPEDFWYDQAENEWVLLLQGSATLELLTSNKEPNESTKTQQVNLRPGDYLLIPSHQRHRVVMTDSTAKTIWLAIHFK